MGWSCALLETDVVEIFGVPLPRMPHDQAAGMVFFLYGTRFVAEGLPSRFCIVPFAGEVTSGDVDGGPSPHLAGGHDANKNPGAVRSRQGFRLLHRRAMVG
jgi:hypothetical protein